MPLRILRFLIMIYTKMFLEYLFDYTEKMVSKSLATIKIFSYRTSILITVNLVTLK